MLKNGSFRSTIKYEIPPQTPKLQKIYFFSPSIRMSGENINLEDKKVEKIDFYKIKRLFKIDEIDVDKILVSKKEPYGTNKSIKYFIGYNMMMLLDHYA